MPKLLKRKATMPSMRVNGTFRPDTVNVEERTIEVCFTTGQGGKRYDWYNDNEYIEELDVTTDSVRTERLDKGLSVIDSHRSHGGIDGVFGITEAYRFEDGELIGTVRFASDEDSDKKFKKAADGILRHVSLGYKVHKYLKSRGENDKLDTYRAVDWEPTELSFVPVSFETTNGVRAEQRENEKTNEVEILVEEKPMNEEQRARLALLQGMTTRSADEDTELNALLAIQSRSAPAQVVEATPATPATPAVDVNSIRANERGALSPMLTAVRNAGIDQQFALDEFAKGTSIDNFRSLVIDKLGQQSNDSIVRTELNSDNTDDKSSKFREAAENALLLRTGSDVEFTEQMRQFSGLTLHDMGRMFIEQSGVSTLGMSRQKVAERAFHSSSDFPLILENVMNKNLQAAYQETPQTFQGLGRRTTVNDFREKHTYTLGDAPNLKPLGENGEYKAGTFSEGKEKYSIATYARKIGFTRQMLINDDMSALDRMPAMFGAAGSRLESDIVWGLLLNYNFLEGKAANIKMADGKTLFHADHKNLLTGAGSALSKTSLAELRKLGRKQKTLDDNYMNIGFNDIVVPEDLELTAEELLFYNIQATEIGKQNPFINKLGLRIEPRLSQVSTTAWYAFSKMVDTFEYAYLAGEQEMYTEVNTHTDIDGLEIKVRKDFGAGLIDWRGMAKANGA